MIDLSHNLSQWLDFFFLKSIYVARNIKILVIFNNFFKAGQMGKLLYILPALISIKKLLNMSIRHDILVLAHVKLFRRINKENIAVSPVFLENDDSRRNSGIKEDIN